MSSAAYDFDEFIKNCSKKPSNIYILRDAVGTAKTDFNLKTQAQILEFIGNDGLENPYLLNVKQWEKNPDPKIEIKVDAYGFYSGEKHGYIAFFFQPATEKWVIKSFKNNLLPDTRNPVFRDALSKLRK